MSLNWQPHERVIRRLYLTENKSLKELMRFMKDEYNFIASKAQYEQQFKDWNFRKYLSHDDWQIVGHRIKKRKRDGKESNVFLNSTLLPNKKVKKELSRHISLSSQHALSPVSSPPTPEGIVISTPPPSPSQVHSASYPNPDGSTLYSIPYSDVINPLTVDLPWAKCKDYIAAQVGLLYSTGSVGTRNIFGMQSQSPSSGYITDFFESPSIQNPLPIYSSEPHVGLNMLLSNLHEQASSEQSTVLIPTDKVLSILGNLGGSISSLDGVPRVPPHLGAMLLEETHEYLQASICRLLDPYANKLMVHILTVAVYLISNNLLLNNQVRTFLEWLIDNGGTSILTSLFQFKLPTIEAFMHQIFPSVIHTGATSLVESILDAGVNVNTRLYSELQYKHHTPLQEALIYKKREIILVLLARGAEVTTHNSGESPLILGVTSDDVEMVKWLLKHGADLNNTRSNKWRTPLQEAAASSSVQMLQLLLNSGAYTHGNYSALPFAIERNCITRVRLLVDAGAPVDLRDSSTDLTPIQLALKGEKPEILTFLEDKSTTCNASTGHVATPRITGEERTAATEPQAAQRAKRKLELELSAAVQRKNLFQVKRLIDSGVNVNAPDDYDDFPLFTAIGGNNIELVKILLNAGARVKGYASRTGILRTPIRVAVESVTGSWAYELGEDKTDAMHIIKLLVSAGADINALSHALLYSVSFEFEATPLQVAAYEGSEEAVKLLLNLGANVNAWPNLRNGMTALQAAAGPLSQDSADEWSTQEERHRIARFLLDHGAEINFPPSYSQGMTALQAAVSAGNAPLVQLLLRKGADVNGGAAYKYGYTALQAAAKWADLDLVRILLDHGADVNGPTSRKGGVTALQSAISRGEEGLEISKLLLSAGAEIESTVCYYSRQIDSWLSTASHRTPLQIASGISSHKAVRLLLDKGANVNEPARGPDYGRTALQAAASSSEGNLELVQMLLDAGADVNAPAAESYGITALQGAASKGYIGIVHVLLKAGADINSPAAMFKGRTALEAAAEHGRLDVVQLLLNANTSGNGSEIRGYKNSIALAKANGHLAIASLLENQP